MARARRGTKKPQKEKKAKPEKAKKQKPEPVMEEDFGPAQDLLPIGLVVLTTLFLLVATVIVWLQLGQSYGAGPFAS